MTPSRTWSGGCAAEIEIRFHFSLRLCLTLLLLHACVIVLLVLTLAPALALALTSLSSLSLFACRSLPCLGWSRHALVLGIAHDDDTWTLMEAGGRMFEARLEEGVVYGASLVFLRWVTGQQRRVAAVLFSDSSDPAALRRLRARLCIAKAQSASEQSAASARARDAARMRLRMQNNT